MPGRTAASVVGSGSTFTSVVRSASLWHEDADGPYFEEILLRVTAGALETPAGSRTSTLGGYCTVPADRFASMSVEDPVVAVFSIRTFVDWVEWVDDGGPVEVSFETPADGSVARSIELSSSSRSARVDCDTDVVIDHLTFEFPDRFTEEDRFVLEDGDLAPTVVSTEGTELRRLVKACEIAGVERYPLLVEDGTPRIEVFEDGRRRAVGRMQGSVDGPDLHNVYGEELREIAHTVEGEVSLQSASYEPLAVVDHRPEAVYRYILLPYGW